MIDNFHYFYNININRSNGVAVTVISNNTEGTILDTTVHIIIIKQ